MAAQRAVRPLGVIALPPLLDDAPGVGQAAKPVNIETLVTELAVETLEAPVLHGLAGVDAIEGHAVLVGPRIQCLPGELGPVIQGDTFGRPVPEDELIEQAHDLLARQRGIHFYL